MDQPGKVANPARGQLNKENGCSSVPVRACILWIDRTEGFKGGALVTELWNALEDYQYSSTSVARRLHVSQQRARGLRASARNPDGKRSSWYRTQIVFNSTLPVLFIVDYILYH